MADEDRISLEGGDELIALLERIGKAGQQTFSDIAKTADAANDRFGELSRVAQAAMANMNKSSSGLDIGRKFNEIKSAASGLGDTVRTVGTGFSSFVGKLALVGGAAGAAVTGIVAIAKSVYAAQSSAARAVREREAAEKQASRSDLQSLQITISQQTAHRQLQRDFAFGRITLDQYTDGLQKLKETTADQRREFLLMSSAQEEFRKDQAKLQVQQEQERQLRGLQAQFGAEATNSLLNLGRAATQVHGLFVSILGPSLAKIFDTLSSVIDDNLGKIGEVFGELAGKVTPVLDVMQKGVSGFASALTDIASSGIAAAFTDTIVPSFTALMGVLDTIAEAINSIFGTNISGLQIFAGALVAVAAAFASLPTVIGALVVAMGVLINMFNDSGMMGKLLVGAIVALAIAFGSVPVVIAAVGVAIGVLMEAMNKAGIDWASIVTFMSDAFSSLSSIVAAVWGAIVDGGDSAAKFLDQIWVGFRDRVQGYWASVRDFILGVWNEVKEIWATLNGGTAPSSSGSSAPGFAQGGHIVGPGGPTEDVIPIWASNGEFMQPTRAVKKYGVAFMEAIRTLRFDPAGFALGGLVSFNAPQPKLNFASGGLVGSKGNTLNLTIGNEEFRGLSVEDTTMERLTKFSLRQQVTSGGRKPGWYK